MKKMRFILVTLLAGLMCIACTPKKEKLIRAYEEACKKGDLIEVSRVVGEMEKEFGDANPDSIFTPAEMARFEAASTVLEQKTAESVMQQLGGAMQQVNDMGMNPYSADEYGASSSNKKSKSRRAIEEDDEDDEEEEDDDY